MRLDWIRVSFNVVIDVFISKRRGIFIYGDIGIREGRLREDEGCDCGYFIIS